MFLYDYSVQDECPLVLIAFCQLHCFTIVCNSVLETSSPILILSVFFFCVYVCLKQIGLAVIQIVVYWIWILGVEEMSM